MNEEIESMIGIQAGITVLLTALISTHQDGEKLQLQIARLIEHVAPKTLWPTLNEKERAVAERYVDFLQQIQTIQGEIDPLSQAGFHWKNR